jgi:aspartyl-tRNA synthetase
MFPIITTPQQSSYRTNNCGELTLLDIGKCVTLCGWIQDITNRKIIFIKLRDRFGITQLTISPENTNYQLASTFKREYVIQVIGTVVECTNKPRIRTVTSDIEIIPVSLSLINTSLTPPFLIEDNTNGHLDIRMQYRYLDIRRKPVLNALMLRHKVAQITRQFLSDHDFLEIETPFLINSTPEGARDFVVPSRMNPGEFYALPQSPQILKQTLMISGVDRYFQIVKCFRDEDLRADRQPEFTQIDCEMSFVNQNDVMKMFEKFMKHILKTIREIDYVEPFPVMDYADAMTYYGSDKPDIRFGMKFVDMTLIVKGKDKNKGFALFDNAEIVVGFCVEGRGSASKTELQSYIEMSQELGATGLVWVKTTSKPTSSVNKFYSEEDLKLWAEKFNANNNDLLIILAGPAEKTQLTLGKLRLALADKLNLRDPNVFKPLWVVNFPLLEWNEEEQRYNSMHHPFTKPLNEDLPLLDTNPGTVRAYAYDLVLNGVETGGGSIRIHDNSLQMLMFKHLGFTEQSANKQFGFLLEALQYGAPPHGGIAFGLDRLCTLLGGETSIRDCMAFPKNNRGRCPMMGAPSVITKEQLDELHIITK